MGDRQAQRGRVTNHILAWLHSYLQVVISHAIRHQRDRGGRQTPGLPWLIAERSPRGAFRELFRRTYQL